jgi:HAMP domain-containing protein
MVNYKRTVKEFLLKVPLALLVQLAHKEILGRLDRLAPQAKTEPTALTAALARLVQQVRQEIRVQLAQLEKTALMVVLAL